MPRARDLEPALELASYVAEVKPCAAGRERGLRPALRGARGHRAGHRADRLRRRDQPRADQQRRRCSSAAGASRSWARCRWTTSPSTSAPTAAASSVGDEALLIGRGPPGRGDGAAAGHHQLRGHVRADGTRAARAPPRRGAAVIEMLREALAGERAWLVGRCAARPAAGPPDARPRRRRRRRRAPRRAQPRAAAPAAPRSSSPTSSAPGAWSPATAAGRSTSPRCRAARWRPTWPRAT